MNQHDTPRNRYSRRAAAAPELRTVALPDHASPPAAALAKCSDEELFELYRAGDERAFEEIVRRYEPQILGFLHRRLRDEERVRELAQDTFLRVHRARDRYDSGRKLSTWIFTIANNLLKNEFRNRSRRREMPFADLGDAAEPGSRAPELESRGPDPEQAAYRGELREAIDRTIEQLDEHHRVPFVMREVEDLTYEEIAEALGVPVGTIKSRLFRARTAFQSLFPAPALGAG